MLDTLFSKIPNVKISLISSNFNFLTFLLTLKIYSVQRQMIVWNRLVIFFE